MSEGPSEYWVVSDRVLISGAGFDAEPTTLPLAIRVRGARIVELRPATEVRQSRALIDEAGPPLPLFDVGAAPIVPGWVNAHTHLAMAPLRGLTTRVARTGNVVKDLFFRIESKMTEADVRAFTKMGAYESLMSGGLFVFDHYYHGRGVAQALAEVGLCGVVAPTLQDQGGPFVHAREEQIQATLDIHQNSQLSTQGIYAAFGPHAGDSVSASLMTRVAELATRHKLPVHLHLAQSAEEVEVLDREGRADFARVGELLAGCTVLMAHGLYLAQSAISALARRGWILAYCPYSQLQFGVLSPWLAWKQAGGRVALGTDCVASNDALDVQRELALVGGDAALCASFSAERSQVLAKGNLRDCRALEDLRRDHVKQQPLIEAGELLALGDGRALAEASSTAGFSACAPLQVGALANFLILDETHPSLYPGSDIARHLAYGSTQGAINWGVVAGRIVGRRDGWQREWLASEEYKDSLFEARARHRELFSRVGIV